MQKTIYIAGKVSGLPRYEVAIKFAAYKQVLQGKGHTPVVPLTLCNKDDAWHVAMKKCISALITCDEVHLLPCWTDSPGARLEKTIAEELAIPIVFV